MALAARCLLVLATLVSCAPAPAPAAEVPVVAVSAGPAGTAPPPPEPTRLPSSVEKRRPMSDSECRKLLSNMIDFQMRQYGMDSQLAAEQRASVMQSLEGDIESCRGRPVTDRQAKCLLDLANPFDVGRCMSD